MLPPMGPFVDNLLWFAVLAALLLGVVRIMSRRPDHLDDLRRSGRRFLASGADLFGFRGFNAAFEHGKPIDEAGIDLFDRWCKNELQRIEDERRRLETRHRDLSEMIDRLRTRAADAGESQNGKDVSTGDGVPAT